MSKIEGVIRVHPNGLNGKALVFVKDKKDLDEAKVKKALEATKKLLLRKMQLTSVSV